MSSTSGTPGHTGSGSGNGTAGTTTPKDTASPNKKGGSTISGTGGTTQGNKGPTKPDVPAGTGNH